MNRFIRSAATLATLAVAASVAVIVPANAQEGDGSTFRDIDGNAHAAMIEALVEAGVTAGCNADGTEYCPAGQVTRGQTASFLQRALGLPPGDADHFADDDASPHEPAIDRLIEDGITFGIDDDSYAPGRAVTREQLASLLVRAFQLQPVSGDRFDDVAGTHEPNVNAVAEEGIALGCDRDGTSFCPKDPVRRDQMASFLGRALGLDDGEEPPGPADGGAGPGSGGPSGGEGEGTETVEDGDVGAPPTDTSAPPPAYVGPRTNRPGPAPSADAVLGYWNDEQLASAAPAAMAGFAPEGGRFVKGGEVNAALYTANQRVLGATSGWQAAPTAGTGRLYYTRPNGTNGTCSATVIGATTLLTAAHCVVNDAGDFRNFLFIPSQQGSSEPHGRWAATVATYFLDYLRGGGAGYVLDYALLHVPPTAGGVTLGSRTGSWPVLKNSHRVARERYAAGYPVDGWFGTWSGNYPWYCRSTDLLYYEWGGGWASKGSGCAANGGFSGGPMFEVWNGRWYVAGVNSTMTYAADGTGRYIPSTDLTGSFTAARSRNWLHNIWGPSFNDWYDNLVASKNR